MAESGGGQKKLQALCDLVMEAFEQAGLLLAVSECAGQLCVGDAARAKKSQSRGGVQAYW